VSLDFQQADLAQTPTHAVNLRLAASPDGIAAADFVLLSYCVHESRAAEHALLPALLRGARAGTVFVLLDVFRKVGGWVGGWWVGRKVGR
jgi:hypothetical protein